MISSLLCPDRLTLTNIICTSGGQHQDWTADYRLYSHSRVQSEVLFAQVIQSLQDRLPADKPLVIGLDDTLIRKTGQRIEGVTWKRDPLGPAFQTNFVRGQRYLQFSAAWPLDPGSQGQPFAPGAARLVPVAFHHAPSAQKLPAKLQGDKEAVALNKAERKEKSLTVQTVAQLHKLRAHVAQGRLIHLVGDGSFTNAAILKNLPPDSIYTGRCRKDAVLHFLPPERAAGSKGRRLSYGPQAPTPEQLRVDDSVPWQQVSAYAAGKIHDFKVKVLEQVLWRKAGAKTVLRVIVIAPLGYRLRKGSKLLYRQPAFLISTGTQMSVEEMLQEYLWRWGIEVNFREEKSLIGTGEAQVRGAAANEHLPAMTVAAYSHLWVAALQMLDSGQPVAPLTPPKWRQPDPDAPDRLPSTGDLLRLLRFDYWASALRPGHFYHFVTAAPRDTKSEKCSPDLPAALLAVA
jgi:DDE superfamily endonuclease